MVVVSHTHALPMSLTISIENQLQLDHCQEVPDQTRETSQSGSGQEQGLYLTEGQAITISNRFMVIYSPWRKD